MRAVYQVAPGARSPAGVPVGRLRISVLPNAKNADLYDECGDDDLAEIQVVEGCEYLYEWECADEAFGSISIEPAEAFYPDSSDGRRGRLRPGLRTGLMRVAIIGERGQNGTLEIEVRSRKLRYLKEYRWMLRDIAEKMTELVISRFAASGAFFTPDSARDAATLYQRFAFLRALLDSEAFRGAMSEIVRRPHVAFAEVEEVVAPGQPMRAGSFLARELSRGGQRRASPAAVVTSVPAALRNRKSEVTHDSTPNRFVRFALGRWQQVLWDLDSGLAACEQTSAVKRGRSELSRALDDLDEWLLTPLFREVSELSRFPADDQVLHRRSGYRDIFRSYLDFELAAHLSWRSHADSYLAGQRDVATLYEYWAFFQLAETVASIVGKSFDASSVIGAASPGMDIGLRREAETVLSGSLVRHGRKLDVQLCFNRTYSLFNKGSWSLEMRPDYSLIIGVSREERASLDPIRLHFDAKYRIDVAGELFGDAKSVERAEASGHARRDDLLKMHAYRDAIRQTSGAYVLYPGSDTQPTQYLEFQGYHELLPGLGAFVLRPSEDGEVAGSAALASFVDQVIEHVARRLTRHERSRYWLNETYAHYDVEYEHGLGALYEEPSLETSVLLGYVRDQAHWTWIVERGVYNLRALGRPGGVPSGTGMLFSRLLLLYGPGVRRLTLVRTTSEPELVSQVGMVAAGYPAPKGDYWCLQIAPTAHHGLLDQITPPALERLALEKAGIVGKPISVTWGELRTLLSN